MLYPEDSSCRDACRLLDKNSELSQGTRQSQVLLDSAIALCPDLAAAWAEKSVPFLKRGDFITWRTYLDKAVELDPVSYLGYRAGCLFDCLRDYHDALEDIERLEKLLADTEIGYNVSGDYRLSIVKAICLREIGMVDSAVACFEQAIVRGEAEGTIGYYDYLHFGVTLLDRGELDRAVKLLEKQIEQYEDFADTYYYLGLAFEKKGDPIHARWNFRLAKDKYRNGFQRNDPYVIMPDQVFLSEIEAKVH
jgi:tetratricopeptide (TPR) repeat protein